MMASPVCEQCGRDAGSWNHLIQTDEGDWLCTSCRVSRIRARKSWPGQRCTMLGCALTAKDHIDEFRRIVSTEAWHNRFASKREEVEEVPF